FSGIAPYPGTILADFGLLLLSRESNRRFFPGMDLHPFRQRTLKQRASLSGIGLHSGARVRATLAPAPADTGLVFVRDGKEIPALADFVVDTTMNTSLGRDGLRVGTVEHLLAALAGCGIDNAFLEVEGPEIPIMDGSADPFVALIREAGIHELRQSRRVFLVRQAGAGGGGGKVGGAPPGGREVSVQLSGAFLRPVVTGA